MKHIKGLDTLRAFAVIFVIIDHWGKNLTKGPVFDFVLTTFIPAGAFGVNLFFVLSGFLITNILLNARNNQMADRRVILKNFFIRRILRIFPAYYLLLTILLLIDYPDIRANANYFLFYASNILVYKNNSWNSFSHTWSLAVEEQFYLIWPWLILFVNEKYIKHTIITFIFIGILSTFLVIKIYHGFNNVLAPNCFDAFGIGGLYAYAMQNEGRLVKMQRFIKKIFPFALAVYLFWKLAPYAGIIIHFNYLSRTIDSIISIYLIDLIIFNRSKWLAKNILENSVLNYIGIISYGIYLYHYTLDPMYDRFIKYLLCKHSFLPSLLGDFYVSFCVKLLLLFCICYVSYEFFEKKIMKLKHLFEYNKT